MKPLTLFDAYQACELEKKWARINRNSSYGIAVDKDPYALEYQRRDRQSRKLEKRLIDILIRAGQKQHENK